MQLIDGSTQQTSWPINQLILTRPNVTNNQQQHKNYKRQDKQARGSSACMKAPSKENYSKSTICDFLMTVTTAVLLNVCEILQPFFDWSTAHLCDRQADRW